MKPRDQAMEPLSLREMRKQTKLTQSEFAKLIGVSRQTLNRWEAGLTVINAVHAAAIREAVAKHKGAGDGASSTDAA